MPRLRPDLRDADPRLIAAARRACYSVAVTPAPPNPPPLPAACAQCTATLQAALPGSAPVQLAFSIARSITGQMRIDYGPTSVIMNPIAQQMTLLDHIKKEVQILPIPALKPPPIPLPPIPGMPAVPPALAPAMVVVDLGIRVIQGIQVAGKQITLPPLTPPKPQVPGMPGAQIPAVPKPLIAEVWTSVEAHLPVLSRITGAFGQQMCFCKNVAASEPSPTVFQIPPDYKQVGAPAPPQPPAPPQAPQMPQAPSLPKPPQPPKFPF